MTNWREISEGLDHGGYVAWEAAIDAALGGAGRGYRPVFAVLRPFAPAVLSPTIGDKATDEFISRPRVERAVFKAEVRRTAPAVTAMTVEPAAAAYLPGEESYVKTIASLSRTVDEQKEAGVLRPSQRVSFERDMAVVNDAIARMKKEVKRNPRNESAKQVLYSSYQNKIDLLNSVSQKEELIASIR